MGYVYSSGMQDALRRLANLEPNLTRLTFRQQKLADELLAKGVRGNKLLHEGQEYDLPPELEQQRILVLQLTGKI
jgi:hypothetical protein